MSTAHGEIDGNSVRIDRKGTDRSQNTPKTTLCQREWLKGSEDTSIKWQAILSPRSSEDNGQKMAGDEPAGKLLCWCLQGGSRAVVSHEVPFL